MYAGRRHPIGILTSYYDWRFVWLPESMEFVSSPSQNPSFGIHVRGPSHYATEVPDWNKSEEPCVSSVYGQESSGSFVKRELMGTPVVKWNDPDLPHFLVSALFKMMSSPVDPIQMSAFDKGRSYIYVRKVVLGLTQT